MKTGDIVTICDYGFTGCILKHSDPFHASEVEFSSLGQIRKSWFSDFQLRPATHEEKLEYAGNSINV